MCINEITNEIVLFYLKPLFYSKNIFEPLRVHLLKFVINYLQDS